MASSWPVERTEMVRTLWLDGYSSSHIALQCGGGVTRNAVIGKVHRMGLEHPRGKRANGIKRTRAKLISALYTPRPSPEHLLIKPKKTRTAQMTIAAGFVSLGGKPEPMQPNKPLAAFNAAIPLEQRKKLWELDFAHCHWPIGDVGTPEFFFCGGARDATCRQPYCVQHRAFNNRP